MRDSNGSSPRTMTHRDQRGFEAEQSVEPATRILIVVDDRRAGRSLARMLTAMGYCEIHAVSSAARAIAAATKHRPSIVFLDVAMADTDAYELARKLRRDARQRALRLIALTERIEISTREEARLASFERWLVTPVAQDELDKVFRRQGFATQ
jgi:CheY-like chemotaxis protein